MSVSIPHTVPWSRSCHRLVDRGGRARAAAAHPRDAGRPPVLANGFSRREQIEQCTGRRTLHVAKAVAGMGEPWVIGRHADGKTR